MRKAETNNISDELPNQMHEVCKKLTDEKISMEFVNSIPSIKHSIN